MTESQQAVLNTERRCHECGTVLNEVAAKPVAWQEIAFDLLRAGNMALYDIPPKPEAWFDAVSKHNDALCNAMVGHTAPLVAEREPALKVLRELVRQHDAFADGLVVLKVSRDAAWDAARALLRNTPEAVSPPREPTQAMIAAGVEANDCLAYPENDDPTCARIIYQAMYDAFKHGAAKERPNAAAHDEAERTAYPLDCPTCGSDVSVERRPLEDYCNGCGVTFNFRRHALPIRER